LQTPEHTKFKNYSIHYLDKKEYHVIKKEIFNQEVYSFEFDKNPVNIVDIGAHIGLSVIYFKEQFPNSRIIAFEPNPCNFELLEKNVFNNNLRNVECIQKAISSKKEEKHLYYNTSNTSTSSFQRNAWNGMEKEQEKVLVECITLNDFVNMDVDLLKMDIEGLEEEVILSSREALQCVSNIVFEFHCFNIKSFDRIVRFLKSCNFYIAEISKPKIGEMCILKGSKYPI